MSALTGIPGPLLEPGSPEWLATISASKVASIVGLNPWTSRFSLWHEMKGNVARPPENDGHRRGHYLEPAIRAWLQDQHPDWPLVEPGGGWTHPDVEWATCSPDGLLSTDGRVDKDGDYRVVEVKTAAEYDGWGPALSDEIPPYYTTQVQWQLWVTGARVAHVAVLLPYLEFREYVVEGDPETQKRLYDAAFDFRLSLHANEAPRLDAAADTYQTLRNLHPDIDDVTAQIGEDDALAWLIAREELKSAEGDEQFWRARIVDAMGDAHYAESLGFRLGDRRTKNGGTPYFQPARTLPSSDTFTTKDAA